MKITLLISSLSGGGAERVVCNIANYLSARGHDVTVLTVSSKRTYSISEAVRCVSLDDGMSKSRFHFADSIRKVIKIRRFFETERPDIYVSFLPKLTELIMLSRKRIDAPIIVAERGNPEAFVNSSSVNGLIFRKLYAKADGYVFQTTDAKKFYQQNGIDTTNSIIIPNAINSDSLVEPFRGARRKVIVGAGRLSSQKNFLLLIEAYSMISDELKEYSVEIFGEGPEKSALQKRIDELELNEKVHLMGYSVNLHAEMNDAALFVLSSDYEGMPNALMEAMAMGIPSISTDCPIGGPSFLIDQGKNGLLVPPSNPVALADAMRDLLSDEEKAQRIGREAENIKISLDPQIIYSKWESFLFETVKRREEIVR